MTLAASPKYLARAGIARDFYRAGEYRCTSHNIGLQNGLTGAREHYLQMHVASERPKLYVVAS